MRNFIFLSLLASTLACQNQKAPTAPRFFIEKNQDDQLSKVIVPQITSPLTDVKTTACERIDSLKQNAGPESYQFLHRIENSGAEFYGGINIQLSPLTQFILGQKGRLMSNEEFKATVEGLCARGEMPWIKCQLFKVAFLVDPVGTQVKAVNEKLGEAFPGIHGEVGSLNKSLYFGLLAKALDPRTLGQKDVQAILTTTLPLLVSSSHSDLLEDMHQSLGSILNSKNLESPTEKACGFVLTQRAVNQMIRLKGYQGPIVRPSSGSIPTMIKPLEANRVHLANSPRGGVFMDPQVGRPVVLEPTDIKAYDPVQRVLLVRKDMDGAGGRVFPGSVAEQTDFFRAALLFFTFTSPASPWWADGYPLGAIDDMKNKAVIPGDLHGLSFGLATMVLKNISAMNLVTINEKGSAITSPDEARGAVVGDRLSAGPYAVTVEGTTGMIHFVVDLVRHLRDELDAVDKAKLQQLQPFYEDAVLEAIKGLNANLLKLRWPMTQLLLELLPEKNCYASIDWDVASGQKKYGPACSADQKRAAALALRQMASLVKSSALYSRASGLEN